MIYSKKKGHVKGHIELLAGELHLSDHDAFRQIGNMEQIPLEFFPNANHNS